MQKLFIGFKTKALNLMLLNLVEIAFKHLIHNGLCLEAYKFYNQYSRWSIQPVIKIDKPELISKNHSFWFHSIPLSTELKMFFSCQVRLGPTFVFAVKGRAVAPSLEFSVTKHNFGKCFLYRPGMVPASHTLLLSNKGEKGIRYLFVCFVCIQQSWTC